MNKPKGVTLGFLIAGIAIVGLIAVSLVKLSNQTPSHVLRVNGKDPGLQAAIKEAQKGLDGFIKELNAPKPGEGFAIKGTFQTLEGPEYLWVRMPTYQDGKFTGKLDQQPFALKGKRKGDEVIVAKKDVVDWLIKDDQGMKGAYTERALGQPKTP